MIYACHSSGDEGTSLRAWTRTAKEDGDPEERAIESHSHGVEPWDEEGCVAPIALPVLLSLERLRLGEQLPKLRLGTGVEV